MKVKLVRRDVKKQQYTRKRYEKPVIIRISSINPAPSWSLVTNIEFTALHKASYSVPSAPEDMYVSKRRGLK